MIADRVGLDIGQAVIKAVRLRRSFIGQESIAYYEETRPAPLDAQSGGIPLADTLRRFIQTHRLEGAEIVTALPCRDLFIRTLALPFRDPKKLVQVVPFEVENLIPLPLEEVAVDYQLLGPSAPGGNGDDKGADVLVAAVPRTTLAQHVELLTEAGIEARLIDVDALALHSLMQYLGRKGMPFPPDLAMIDIGASKTTVCLTRGGHPALIRTIGWGGQQLTQALAKRHACSQAEAEDRKRTLSAGELAPWLTTLCRDLQITLHGYETATKTRLKHFWLSGGGSELPGLSAWLGQQLTLQPVEPPETMEKLLPPPFAIALGLAAKPQRLQLTSRLGIGQQTAVAINLNRVPAAAVEAEDTARRQQHRWLAAGLGLLLLLGLADLGVNLWLKERRAEELSAALRERFQTFFPGLEAGPDPVDQARGALAATQKTLSFLGGDQPDPLPLLRELTKRLPKGIPVRVSALTVERGELQLDAETESFEAVEKVKQSLQGFPGAREVTVSETRVGAAANQVRFRVTIVLPS